MNVISSSAAAYNIFLVKSHTDWKVALEFVIYRLNRLNTYDRAKEKA